MKVAVLGSGNGGCAVAFDFAQHGHDVYLYDQPQFPQNISAVAKAGGIRASGELKGFARIAGAGHDAECTLKDADIIFAVGPSYSTIPFAETCKPFIEERQMVVVCPGSCGGAIVFKKTLDEELVSQKYIIAETSTLPYAVRADGAGNIQVFNKLKGGLFLAGLPGSCGQKVLDQIKEVYPHMSLARNVMHTFLQNGNPVIHPAVVIMNAALTERDKNGFMFYEEGITPAVGRLIKAVDDERIAIARAIGIEVIPDPRLGCMQGYQDEENYDHSYNVARGFKGIAAPETLRSRYLIEDVGHSMIILRALAEMVGIKTPTMDAIIRIASVILEEELLERADQELAHLGLDNIGIEKFMELVNK